MPNDLNTYLNQFLNQLFTSSTVGDPTLPVTVNKLTIEAINPANAFKAGLIWGPIPFGAGDVRFGRAFASGIQYAFFTTASGQVQYINMEMDDIQPNNIFIESNGGLRPAAMLAGPNAITALQYGSQAASIPVIFIQNNTERCRVTSGTSGNLNLASLTATPAGGSATAFVQLGTTANFGVYYGSGAPTVSAAQGSLYMRSDGAINTRMYVNTNGATTWTGVTSTA